MLASLEVPVPFSQPEVDDVDSTAVFSPPHHEVVRFYIPMHETLPVDLLEPSDDLDSDVERGCQRKRL